MRNKIRFYKELLAEVIETLCTICLYLEQDGKYQRIPESQHFRSHFTVLKKFSEDIRNGKN